MSEYGGWKRAATRGRRWWLDRLSVAFAGSRHPFVPSVANAEQSGFKFMPGRCYARLLPKSYRRV